MALVAVSCGTAETSVDSAEPDSAADVLMSAVRDLKAADSGHFTHSIQLTSEATAMAIEHDGRYRLSAGTSEVTTDTSESSASLITRYVDGVAYMNSPGWPDGRDVCWLVLDEEALGSETGLAVDLAGAPEAVAALDVVEGESFGTEGRDVVVGSVDLGTAVHLMVSARYAVDLARGLDGRVQARFEIDDEGGLSAWSVRGEDVAAAIASTTELDNDIATALPAVGMRIAYSGLGDSVVVEAPAADSLMTPEQMDSGDGCSLME